MSGYIHRRGLLTLCGLLASCTGPQPRSIADAGASKQPVCIEGIACDGDVARVCTAQGKLVPIDCHDAGLQCVEGLGCVTCAPSQRACDGDVPIACREDGSGWERSPSCDGELGLHCNRDSGTCADLCALAEDEASYIGCEYWPTVTSNPELRTDFSFAVAVSNPQAVPARVMVGLGGDSTKVVTRAVTIAPDALEVIKLPWLENLRRPEVVTSHGQDLGSMLVPQAAYRLTSDVPVTVYQFNALEYEVDHDCAVDSTDKSGDGKCFSYTNDASLLLPSHVLTGDYMVTSRESQRTYETVVAPGGTIAVDKQGKSVRDKPSGAPGFLAVVAVDDRVAVELGFTAYTASGVNGGAIGAYAPGSSETFRLRRGDVLQILSASLQVPPTCRGSDDSMLLPDGFERQVRFCAPDRDYDLTGTRIHADGRVAVIAGHSCALVPFDRFACDHLEESMFPMQTWGSEFVVATTTQLVSEPNLIRVLAAHDATVVSFDPAVHEPVILDQGQFVEFETVDDFVMHSSGPLTVSQFLVGQDYAGLGTSMPNAMGDPAFGMVTPADQYRKRYAFLAPDTYSENWISVVSADGERVELDGRAIDGWARIGNTGKQATRVAVSPGAHRMESQGRFGVTVYGFGAYTSYIYSAGLDFQKIVDVL